MKDDKAVEVLVIGAGMAGLTAARALAERGVKVCVVEAQDRVGGRVLTRKTAGGGMVELGAEFVHGRAPELWALISEAGVATVERDGTMLREQWGGGVAEDDPQDAEMFVPLEELENFVGEDISFAEWLLASDVPAEERGALVGYVEGFNAADAQRIGVKGLGAQQKAEGAIEGDWSWHVVGGYVQLAEYLVEKVRELGVEVRLGCEVAAVRWDSGRVTLETSQGEIVAAKCIVTLPLGVLHRVNREGGVRMEPEPAAVAAAQRMAMGDAARFTMVFRERWWEQSTVCVEEALRRMSFLFTPERLPPVWWTGHPETEALPTLTGWVGGPRAAAFLGKSAEALGQAACAALAEVFAMERGEVTAALVETHVRDWAADPYALGAYSYVPAGAIDAPKAMAAAEAGTMFFAGEHTDLTANWGTVHAAVGSGWRAARQVLGEDEA
jgi:monoamine oxidase